VKMKAFDCEIRRNPKCPEDIILIGRNNPIIAACLQGWKHGLFTWEQMLMECVVHLVNQNDRMRHDAVAAALYGDYTRWPENFHLPELPNG
jgi:hypothetical protein